MASMKSSRNRHVLIKYLIGLQPHFVVMKESDIANSQSFSVNDEIYMKFPETIRLCKVMSISDDFRNLRTQIPSRSDEPIVIDDDDSESETNRLQQEPIDEDYYLRDPPEEMVPREGAKMMRESSRKKSVNENVQQYIDILSSDDDEDMVILGANGTKISKVLYSAIDWTCYKVATRRLLLLLFSKTTLATHSLIGKRKKQLDVKMTADIVDTITERFDVSKNSVHKVISLKCATVSKTMKNRSLRMQMQIKK